MKLVLTTKLSRYKDLYETTLMLKELTETIKILQFRSYFKFRMSLHKLICKNYTTETFISVAIICFNGSEKEGDTAQCIMVRLGHSKKF